MKKIPIINDMDKKIKNPMTGRWINVGGKTYKKLIKSGDITPEVITNDVWYGPLSIPEILDIISETCDIKTIVSLYSTCKQLKSRCDDILFYKRLECGANNMKVYDYDTINRALSIPLHYVKRIICSGKCDPRLFICRNDLTLEEYKNLIVSKIKEIDYNTILFPIDSSKLIELLKIPIISYDIHYTIANRVNYESWEHRIILLKIIKPYLEISGIETTIGNILSYARCLPNNSWSTIDKSYVV